MSKILFLVVVFFLNLPTFSNAQAISQVWQLGGNQHDIAWELAVDAAGNMYQTGAFQENITIGVTTLAGTSVSNAFLSKSDPYGNVIWVLHLGGSGDIWAPSLACDSLGNCYLTGRFNGQLIVGTDTLLSQSADGYLIRTLPKGTADWVKKFGGAADDYGNSVSADQFGRCYLAGTFRHSVTLGAFTYNMPANQQRVDAFVALFDSTGQVIWANRSDCADCRSTVSAQIACDNQGNVYLSGTNSGKAQFNQVQFGENGIIGGRMFLLKFGISGEAEWVHYVEEMLNVSPVDLHTDQSGNCYFLSWHEYASSVGGPNFALRKLNSNGSLIYVSEAQDVTPNEYGSAIPYDLTTDANGNTLVAGTFAGMLQIGPSVIETDMWAESPFVACYDSSGTALWATRLTTGTAPDSAFPYGLVWQPNGQAWVSGYFEGTATFGSQSLTSNGPRDIFLLRLGNVSGFEESEQAFSAELNLFPNPAANSVRLSFVLTQPATVSCQISNLAGQVLQQHSSGILESGNQQFQLPVNKLASGMYLCTVRAGNSLVTRKLVIAR